MSDHRPTPPAAVESEPWELASETVETVFRTPTSRVEGHTLLYEDARLRAALEPVVPDFEGPWRFFFATRLRFVPELVPGVGTASVYPTVASEAATKFEEDLRERGFEDVERRRSERVRVETYDRARLVKYAASYPDPSLEVEGWTGVWSHDGGFRVAGGAYPVEGLDSLLEEFPADERPPTDPVTFRDELVELICGVR
jgi:hypothetical protein